MADEGQLGVAAVAAIEQAVLPDGSRKLCEVAAAPGGGVACVGARHEW